MLVLQPASGLQFPAVEALREAIITQALEGMRAEWGGCVRALLPPMSPHPSLLPQDPSLVSALGRPSRSCIREAPSGQRRAGACRLHAAGQAVPNLGSYRPSLSSGALGFREEKGPVCSQGESLWSPDSCCLGSCQPCLPAVRWGRSPLWPRRAPAPGQGLPQPPRPL